MIVPILQIGKWRLRGTECPIDTRYYFLRSPRLTSLSGPWEPGARPTVL